MLSFKQVDLVGSSSDTGFVDTNRGDLSTASGSDCSKGGGPDFAEASPRGDLSTASGSDCSKGRGPDFAEASLRRKPQRYVKSKDSKTTENQSRDAVWRRWRLAAAGVGLTLFVVCLLTLNSQASGWRQRRGRTSDADVVNGDLKILLLGNVGTGKSSTGNTLLGREAFAADASATPVTQSCEVRSAVRGGTNITVIDTPGVTIDMRPRVAECVDASEPHVLLLVIRVGRFTEAERSAAQWIQTGFGDSAPNFTLVVFTHVDLLKGKPLEVFLEGSRDLQRLLAGFGGRYHGIDNEARDCDQVAQLLRKAWALRDPAWGYAYTRRVVQEAASSVREQEREVCLGKLKEEEGNTRSAEKEVTRARQQVADLQSSHTDKVFSMILVGIVIIAVLVFFPQVLKQT